MAGDKNGDVRTTIHEALSNFSLQLKHGSGEEVAESIDKLTDAIMLLIKPEEPIDGVVGDLQAWE